MIFLLAAVLAATTPSADASAQARYHIYEIPAPAQRGVFRLRLSDDAGKQWAIEQIHSISMYDNAGKRLSCEELAHSRLGTTKKSYPLIGTWRDLDKEPARAGSQGRLNFAWRFAMPTLAENETAAYLHFDFQSKVSNAGEVRLVEVPPNPQPYSRPVDTFLERGHVELPMVSMPPRTWAPTIDLLFTLSQEELTIESPMLDTQTKRPWTLTPAPGPGWIIFTGNGNTPYRLQLGDVLYGCGGAGVDESVQYPDPEWPPELVSGAEIANAAPMGETPASWNKQVEQRAGERVQGSWLAWGSWIGFLFVVALGIALFLPKR